MKLLHLVTRSTLLFLGAFLVIVSANASELTVGSISYHFSTNEKYNNLNPTVVYTTDSEYVLGYFENSYYRDSFIAAKKFSTSDSGVELGMLVGVVSGYEKGELMDINPCYSGVCLVAIPIASYSIGNWKPTIIFGGTFVSLAVGYKF